MKEDVLYGINPVLEALRAKRRILRQVIMAGERTEVSLIALRQLAREKGIPIAIQPKEALTKLARTTRHQGIIGLLADNLYVSFDDLLRSIRSQSGWICLLILDGIEDPKTLDP